MAIKKQILLGVVLYGFFGYLIIGTFKPAILLPTWTLGVYFALATAIVIWACIERDWKLRGLVGLGVLGYVGVAVLIGLLLLI